MSLLESLIIVSEKAANVARKCRQEEHLFNLLVQQKNPSESNPRFIEDFKTLADVLIQETVKHDIGKLFPALCNHIKGEESNTFSNKLGETICVEVKDTVEETAKLLEKVLNGDSTAASLLAAEVHKEINVNSVNTSIPTLNENELQIEALGIWIDPIDSTAEYINSIEKIDENRICLSGLQCVTVLLGVFIRKTGLPVAGVINQPFHNKTDNRWIGKCYWGFSTPTTNHYSVPISKQLTNLISLSSSEDISVKMKLKQKGFKLIESAGAGYKILLVITGITDAYVLSKDSTFKWDTCGPQAILKSLGGNIIHFTDARCNQIIPVNYKNVSNDGGLNKLDYCCNYGGIVAYKCEQVLNDVLEAFN